MILRTQRMFLLTQTFILLIVGCGEGTKKPNYTTSTSLQTFGIQGVNVLPFEAALLHQDKGGGMIGSQYFKIENIDANNLQQIIDCFPYRGPVVNLDHCSELSVASINNVLPKEEEKLRVSSVVTSGGFNWDVNGNSYRCYYDLDNKGRLFLDVAMPDIHRLPTDMSDFGKAPPSRTKPMQNENR